MIDRRIALAQAGDKPALEGLMADNAPLVWSIARRFFGRGVEGEDLFQLGSIGLLKAVRDFDLSREVAFSTYAVPKIAGEIRRFLRDDGPVKVSRTLRERAALVLRVRQQLEEQTGESPRLSVLCAGTGLTAEEVTEALSAPYQVESLEAPVPGQERTLAETLPGADHREELADRADLQSALARLPDTWQRVIALRYLHDMTQARTGAVLGMSQVQVSRVEKKALAALRMRLK